MNKSIDKMQEALRVERALKLALEALEYDGLLKRKQAITAIRAALASKSEALAAVPEAHKQPAQVDPCIDGSCSCCWTHLDEQPAPVAEPHKQQEPVAWRWKMSLIPDAWQLSDQPHPEAALKEPLYTSPPIEATPLASQRSEKPWRGLTDKDLAGCDDEEFKQARYWEQVLREKNT